MEHLQKEGLKVQNIKNTQEWLKVKREFGLETQFQSCHTAKVGDYYLEGHIPARDIKRLLEERPKDVLGLSVPGMPAGSPGMDQGKRVEPYVVYVFKKDGSVGVWARH